jgi:creatinine amidohydrolase
MKLSHCTWQQVEEHLKSKPHFIVPIGSTEQHGPTGLIGTDYLSANAIAEQVGEKMGILVAPPICFGMALHHLAFPGTVTLRPETLIAVIKDVVWSLKSHGAKRVTFINGHGGNIPTVTTAFSAIKDSNDTTVLEMFDWWRLPEVQAYENEHFGDQNGFHATVGEVSVTMHTDAIAFEKIKPQQFKVEKFPHHWPMSPVEFRKTFTDGRMASNPGLATRDHGKKIFDIAVNGICQRISGEKVDKGH